MRIFVCILFSVFMHGAGFFVLPEDWEEGDPPQVAVRKGVSALTLRLPQKKTVTKTEQEKPAEKIEIVKEEKAEDTAEPDPQSSDEEQNIQESGDEGVISLDALAGGSIPKYPLISRRRGEEGTVILNVTIDKNGKCIYAEIVTSTGYSRLDRSALKWAREEIGIPKRKGKMNIKVTIPFELTKSNTKRTK